MPRELRRGSGEILRKTKLRDVRTLSVLNKFIIGMSDCKEKNAKKPHNENAINKSNKGKSLVTLIFLSQSEVKKP